MEFFKTGKVLIFVLLLSAFSGASAQETMVTAFKESYTLEQNGAYAKAIEKLKSIYDENSYEINLRLGWLNYQAGQFYESKSFYSKAIALKPYAIEPKLGMAYPAYALGKTEEVISLYQMILEIDPQNTIANYRMGLLYYYKGSYEKAESYFEKVINLYPFDYDSLIMFAWTKLKLQKNKEAKVLFTKALLNKPDDASALEGLGYIK
ncbi:MAG TPA: tetratricopeptide repeat protein [Bacteroidales bacterium]|nr:tetratricopeptide repeat protein [Bacteroidales bacterium]HOV12143.1 tetratricopeptide repeat protein [Bacteroidales bacterium]HPS27203.1 tetratricopeptide repeat protein [Bacteroidales bacterium]HQI70002.1 tetratricopeptide repeat protein [Bacteroidales bacterium]